MNPYKYLSNYNYYVQNSYKNLRPFLRDNMKNSGRFSDAAKVGAVVAVCGYGGNNLPLNNAHESGGSSSKHPMLKIDGAVNSYVLSTSMNPALKNPNPAIGAIFQFCFGM